MLDFYLDEEKKQSDVYAFALSNITNDSERQLFCDIIFNQLIILQSIIFKLINEQGNESISDLLNNYLINYQQQKQLFLGYGFVDLLMQFFPDLSFPGATARNMIAVELPLSDGINELQTNLYAESPGDQYLDLEPGILTAYINEPFNDSQKEEPILNERQTMETQKNESHDNNYFIYINGKLITRGAFYRRAYFFQDKPEQLVTRDEKKRAEFGEDGTVWVDGRQIIWKQKNGLYRSKQLLFIDGKHITRDIFYSRTYFFQDKPEQLITRDEKKRAEFGEDGTVWVDGRQIIWRQKNGSYVSLRFIMIDGKQITLDAFLKRPYFFQDKPEQSVTRDEKKRAEFGEDGTVWVDGRQIIWEQKKALHKDEFIYISGKQITLDAFYKRTYFFQDKPEQLATLDEKKRAEFYEDGTVWIDGRQIIWKQKNGLYKSLRLIMIDGKQITLDAFLRRTYFFQDTPEQLVTRDEKKRAEFGEDGTVCVDGRQIIWKSIKYFSPQKRELERQEEIPHKRHQLSPQNFDSYNAFFSNASTSPMNLNNESRTEESVSQPTVQPHSYGFFSSPRLLSVHNQTINRSGYNDEELNMQLSLLLESIEYSTLNQFIDRLRTLVKEHNFYDLASFCSNLLEHNENQKYILTLRGEAYRRLNDFNLALNDLNEVLEIDSGDISALIFRSALYFQFNEHDSASRDMDAVADLKYCNTILD